MSRSTLYLGHGAFPFRLDQLSRIVLKSPALASTEGDQKPACGGHEVEKWRARGRGRGHRQVIWLRHVSSVVRHKWSAY